MRYIIIFFTFVCSINLGLAQSVVGSAGSTLTSNGVQLSYTVGETGVGYSNPSESVLAGFNQPSIQEDKVSVAEIKKLQFKAFPNPVHNTLMIQNEVEGRFTITDVNGKQVLVTTEVSANSNYALDMSSYAKGVYFLKFYSGNRTSTLRIIKS
jgi:hypothetical protein